MKCWQRVEGAGLSCEIIPTPVTYPLPTHCTGRSKTLHNHVSNIFSKLHVRTRSEAIIKARDAGMDG
jgi:hypothetical protein